MRFSRAARLRLLLSSALPTSSTIAFWEWRTILCPFYLSAVISVDKAYRSR